MSAKKFTVDDLDPSEVQLEAIRAQGAGGQNVNKVSSAIHLRFDIKASSLPAAVKERMLSSRDKRITEEGVLILKAQNHRTQLKNREEALERLVEIIDEAHHVPEPRRATKPSFGQKMKRLDGKKQRAQIKGNRKSVSVDD